MREITLFGVFAMTLRLNYTSYEWARGSSAWFCKFMLIQGQDSICNWLDEHKIRRLKIRPIGGQTLKKLN